LTAGCCFILHHQVNTKRPQNNQNCASEHSYFT